MGSRNKSHVHIMTHVAQGAAALQFWAMQNAMGGMLQEPYHLLRVDQTANRSTPQCLAA